MSTHPAPEDLVGRDRLLTRLAGLVDRAAGGERQTVLVSGEAGIGKTALVRAAVADADARGARVGWGICIDVDGAPGYWPWTQLLNGMVRAVRISRARKLARGRRRISRDDRPGVRRQLAGRRSRTGLGCSCGTPRPAGSTRWARGTCGRGARRSAVGRRVVPGSARLRQPFTRSGRRSV